VRKAIDEKTTDVVFLEKLRQYFENLFLKDEHGNLRVWTFYNNIDESFKRATDKVGVSLYIYQLLCQLPLLQALHLIPQYSRISPLNPALLPNDNSFNFDPLVFTEEKAKELNTRFQRDAYMYLVGAKQTRVSSFNLPPSLTISRSWIIPRSLTIPRSVWTLHQMRHAFGSPFQLKPGKSLSKPMVF
jgi:hypothetical protein